MRVNTAWSCTLFYGLLIVKLHIVLLHAYAADETGSVSKLCRYQLSTAIIRKMYATKHQNGKVAKLSLTITCRPESVGYRNKIHPYAEPRDVEDVRLNVNKQNLNTTVNVHLY